MHPFGSGSMVGEWVPQLGLDAVWALPLCYGYFSIVFVYIYYYIHICCFSNHFVRWDNYQRYVFYMWYCFVPMDWYQDTFTKYQGFYFCCILSILYWTLTNRLWASSEYTSFYDASTECIFFMYIMKIQVAFLRNKMLFSLSLYIYIYIYIYIIFFGFSTLKMIFCLCSYFFKTNHNLFIIKKIFII